MTVETPAWVRDAVFYQIFPDRFAASERVRKPGPMEAWDTPPTSHGFKGGDLLGIAEHLDYLADLGITGLYLTPIFASASNHRYHTYDYHAVDPLLGGDAALRELLDAAHAHDIRVILDGVFNHTGRGFWPFHHVLETGAASPYRGWFHFDNERLDTGRQVVAYPHPEAPRGDHGYRAWWGLPALPKLNTDNPDVREYLFGVAEHWLRFGIDGWRLDVPSEIDDESFWQEFHDRCRAVRSDAYLVGEIWRSSPDWLRGDRFDALMNYPLAAAINGFVGGDHLDGQVIAEHHELSRSIRALDGAAFAARVVELDGAYDSDVVAVQLNLLGSHDTPRVRTLLGDDPQAVRLATLLQMTLPGAPCVYYGDEVGLAGGNDPACRGAFPWDDRQWEPGLRDTVRSLVALRGSEPALRSGPVTTAGADGRAVAIVRGEGSGRHVVAVNPGDTPVALPIHFADGTRDGARLVPIELPGLGHVPAADVGDGGSTLMLVPRTGAVMRLA